MTGPLSRALAAAAALVACRPTATPSSPMLAALHADGPLPALRDALMTFGQFVGEWDMDITFIDEHGAVKFHGPGRWRFDWVLDGRAVQDVLTYAQIDDPARTAPGQRRIGSTLRHYDPVSGTWRVIWLGATSGTLILFTGGRAGDRLVLEGSEAPGIRNRWSFSAIERDRFHWTGEISSDGGATWRLEQEMFAQRVL